VSRFFYPNTLGLGEIAGIGWEYGGGLGAVPPAESRAEPLIRESLLQEGYKVN